MCEEELLDSAKAADNLLVVVAGWLTDILSRRYHMCHLFYFSPLVKAVLQQPFQNTTDKSGEKKRRSLLRQLE